MADHSHFPDLAHSTASLIIKWSVPRTRLPGCLQGAKLIARKRQFATSCLRSVDGCGQATVHFRSPAVRAAQRSNAPVNAAAHDAVWQWRLDITCAAGEEGPLEELHTALDIDGHDIVLADMQPHFRAALRLQQVSLALICHPCTITSVWVGGDKPYLQLKALMCCVVLRQKS